MIECQGMHGGEKLDGALQTTTIGLTGLVWLTLQIAEPMNACSFAAGLSSQETGVGTGFGAFHGQMGCIYLFEDVLNPGKTTVSSSHVTHLNKWVSAREHYSRVFACLADRSATSALSWGSSQGSRYNTHTRWLHCDLVQRHKPSKS